MMEPVTRHKAHTDADLDDLQFGDLSKYLPVELQGITDLQTAIPRIAKDIHLTGLLASAVRTVPTEHRFIRGDARTLRLKKNSIHLVVTSPPYWTLKQYRDSEGQMGHISDYQEFLTELDIVWSVCFDALVPGGRLVCVVGDVCLSRRKNEGRHTVVPLHASIQEHCRVLGFDNLSPIIWHKIANAAYEVENGGGFLGKPYEPNAVIKNDIEFILMQRKPGGYRTPDHAARLLSIIAEHEHKEWFRQIWSGLTGASTRDHPAPYPEPLAERLIRMFSFAGDIVLDPFMGTGTTSVAAAGCGRNSISVEIDHHYFQSGLDRMHAATTSLFPTARVTSHELSEAPIEL